MEYIVKSAEFAGLIIGNASYRLFGNVSGGRKILTVGPDRVAGTIGLQGGPSIPRALTIVTENGDREGRLLEVHDLNGKSCSHECAAWAFSSSGKDGIVLHGVDLQSGKRTRVPDRLYAAELWIVASILEALTFSGASFDVLDNAKHLKTQEDDSLELRLEPSRRWQRPDKGLLDILQGSSHRLAFSSSKGYLDQVRGLIEP